MMHSLVGGRYGGRLHESGVVMSFFLSSSSFAGDGSGSRGDAEVGAGGAGRFGPQKSREADQAFLKSSEHKPCPQ